MKLRRFNVCVGLAIGLAILCGSGTATAATWIVNEGESIQDAVNNASAGDSIVVMPGTYMETHGGVNAVEVTKDGMRLIARVNKHDGEAGKVKIVPGPGNDNGIAAIGASDVDPLQGFTVRGFTIEGFDKHGIYTRYVNKFKIDRNESINNLENGIFPTLSANGLVRRNLSYGSLDTSLWVEASENVRVIRNVLHSSPTGLEITVSNNIVARRNEVYNNAVGIGLYHPFAASLPPLPVMENWKIERNYVHDNNGPNNAPTGSLSAQLPIGGGILVLGVHDHVVKRNRVENNDFFGVAVVDWCVANLGTPFACSSPWPPDALPQNNKVLRNTLTNNGTDPPPHPADIYAADIVMLLLNPNHNNCFKGNQYSTSHVTLPGDPPPPEC